MSKPKLILAKKYREGRISLGDYAVSEKFDGMRAFWDGEKMWSRGGNEIAIPKSWLSHLPAFHLDGEIWGGRGKFDVSAGVARRKVADEVEWASLCFMVFDVPNSPEENLFARLRLVVESGPVKLVVQSEIFSHSELLTRMRDTVTAGGEGLMLRKKNSHYVGERTSDLLKVKPQDDAEAVVVGHQPGRGKYRGQVGALIVEFNGFRFKAGSGMNDVDRLNPPPIGAVITFGYVGLTSKGKPRFPTFIRVRSD